MLPCSVVTLTFSFITLEAECFLGPFASEGTDTPVVPFSQWNL